MVQAILGLPFQPVHFRSGNATVGFKASGSSFTSAPGTVIGTETTAPPSMSGTSSCLEAGSTVRSAAFVSPWARRTGFARGVR